ncbi:Cytochrome c oxidase polypeptide 4,mitochondrial [Wickerhamomyces ciferrii]|uniref:Cytochrome c oxidase subunit 4, mitochondrial n=1 Tax=Wickerhamomyces ciferrii (strain ATCC 14091 / BCRC 22168 / CBS 111 / JCM 3599 / NBRC 0793 / NRRL Y-1031 F-60-10) TaxID=1206466 RepID=K0KGV5_WICCF|nr:Cytochrome c oxidase polypeptide 4,mitochondrial [Wickerhamomyces ciferrii]CCH41417.1 Cytochrome c oxidase polypeptide 4,mitochondrial [Wickerhamomyces ciferrii]
MFALRSRLSTITRFQSPIRSFSSSRLILQSAKPVKTASNLAEVDGKETLIGPGAKEGTFPTDLEQATGLERLELLGKLEGIEVFDTKPLDSSRRGTMADPILVESYDDYRYVGCTGSPADSHVIEWLKPTVESVARCWECGSVYKLKPVGVPHDDHH